MDRSPAQGLRRDADTTHMVGSVQVQLLSLQLGAVREAMSDAQAVSVQPGGTTVQAEVILKLSPLAQQLLSSPQP